MKTRFYNQTPPQNNQDAFNRVWQFFILDNHAKSKSEDGVRCLYRGYGEGQACVVGCMMPTKMAKRADGKYDACGESAISFIVRVLPSAEEWFNGVDLGFLVALQDAHDSYDFDSNKFSLLTNLSKAFGLSVPIGQRPIK